MKLSKHSKNNLLHSFAYWQVERDYADPVIAYLVDGYEPGSFFHAVLANDFVSAMGKSHPGNSVTALKNLSGWIVNVMPGVSWGSYEKVKDWLSMPTRARRTVLEDHELIFTEQDEVVLILKDTPTKEPSFYF